MKDEKKFKKPEAEIVSFDNEDAILTSTYPIDDESVY